MSEVVALRGVSKHYHVGETVVKALDRVSLTVHRGEMVAIIGPSGSGKSTLMNVIGCLDRPTDGRVLIEGQEVSQLSDDQLSTIRNRRIGFVFQQFHLLPRLSVLENVMLPLIYARVKPTVRRERAIASLERVGLADRMRHTPTELSGGQKQRVAIARALVTDPHFLMADEPTGSLDTVTSETILRLFSEINANGRTVIIVTHDPEVSAGCPRVIGIRDGHAEEQRQ